MMVECVWPLFGCHLYVFAVVVEWFDVGVVILRMLVGVCLDVAYTLFSGCSRWMLGIV